LRRRAVVLLALTPVLASCAGGVGNLSFPDPPSTTVPAPPPPDSLPAGLASTPEQPVPGVTTTTAPAIGPGTGSLGGSVTGPNGSVVPGATVEIDRVVGYASATARTTTAADGSWVFHNILGGDYRVRAWLAPQLDMPTPTVIFLANGQSQNLTLQETSYQGQQVQVAINPSNPVLGESANLVVQVTNPSIDSAGVLTSPPVVGASVTLVNGPGWQVQNGNPITTDTAGQATFVVQCTQTGADPLGAQVGSSPPVSLEMPPCGAPAPTTTTTTTLFGETTTTCPPAPGATTTTLNFGSNC
jgi:hypothetical protein